MKKIRLRELSLVAAIIFGTGCEVGQEYQSDSDIAEEVSLLNQTDEILEEFIASEGESALDAEHEITPLYYQGRIAELAEALKDYESRKTLEPNYFTSALMVTPNIGNPPPSKPKCKNAYKDLSISWRDLFVILKSLQTGTDWQWPFGLPSVSDVDGSGRRNVQDLLLQIIDFQAPTNCQM